MMARTQALQGDSLAGLSRHQAGNGARGELRGRHSGAPLQSKAPAGRQAAAAAALRQLVAAGRGQPRPVLLPSCCSQWRKRQAQQSAQGEALLTERVGGGPDAPCGAQEDFGVASLAIEAAGRAAGAPSQV